LKFAVNTVSKPAVAALVTRRAAAYPLTKRLKDRMEGMRFQGTSNYVATDDLKVAVNAAAAAAPAAGQGRAGHRQDGAGPRDRRRGGLIEWNIKSTTKAQQGLYEYDAVARLRDGQLGDERPRHRQLHPPGKLWEAFSADAPVLLIDEIDKADIEFPNDLLQELDRMEFFVYETGRRSRPATPDRHHHLEQREGAAGRLPAPLLLPLHQVPRPRHDAGDRRRALPRHQEDAGEQGAESSSKCATCPA
jgi:hypothetical protein